MTNENLQLLLDKEAIRDQIYSYWRALDRIDNELGYSVFAEDSTVNYGETFPSGTGRQFIDNMLEQHRHMVSTHHMMTNILIKVNGDKAASETYMFAAVKMKSKKGEFTVDARCRDIDRWERRDGKWLIVDRVVAGDNTALINPTSYFDEYNTYRDSEEDHSYTVFAEI